MLLLEDKILHKNVIIIGCGGIGSHLLPPLMRYLQSLLSDGYKPNIILIDGDKYSVSNMGRQEFAIKQIGCNKAEAQAQLWRTRYKESHYFETVKDYIGEANVESAIPDDSVVFLCVDNHVCRRIVSSHCQSLANVLLISAGNELTDGNIQHYFKCDGEAQNYPLEHRHPEILSTDDGDRATMSCDELQNLPSGGQIIVTNLMAATLMFNLYWAVTTQPRMREFNYVSEIYFDTKYIKTRKIVKGVPE